MMAVAGVFESQTMSAGWEPEGGQGFLPDDDDLGPVLDADTDDEQ